MLWCGPHVTEMTLVVHRAQNLCAEIPTNKVVRTPRFFIAIPTCQTVNHVKVRALVA